MTLPAARPATLLERRRRLLSPTYQLFYEEPLQLVRAAGVWMYDREGRAYLDAYNNVAVVGHCHPRVVEALSRQASILNTHTRYLAEEPLQLAETLFAYVPAQLRRVIYTCTGSEANDLAVRVAKAVTGGSGFIVSEFAYHGATDVVAGLSPEDGGPPGPGVYTVAPPRRGESPDDYGERVRQCIARMQADGVRLAALLIDTILASDGIVAEPRGFLASAAREVRAAGGLFIADEVQPGFGRLGESMWGFERHGVAPDLVTLGKPMGNGHPVAALLARPELLDAFGQRTRYFNTYGGNNVSCAVALAVLQVIRDEQLLENARHSGEYLRRGLAELAQRHGALREVRGAGLFIGVQLPDAAVTAQVVNGLRRHGVLVGTTGRGGDVLKIRPPLVFGVEHADRLLEALERTLPQ